MISKIIVNNKYYFHLVNETQLLWLTIQGEERISSYILSLKLMTDSSEALLKYYFVCGFLLGPSY